MGCPGRGSNAAAVGSPAQLCWQAAADGCHHRAPGLPAGMFAHEVHLNMYMQMQIAPTALCIPLVFLGYRTLARMVSACLNGVGGLDCIIHVSNF